MDDTKKICPNDVCKVKDRRSIKVDIRSSLKKKVLSNIVIQRKKTDRISGEMYDLKVI